MVATLQLCGYAPDLNLLPNHEKALTPLPSSAPWPPTSDELHLRQNEPTVVAQKETAVRNGAAAARDHVRERPAKLLHAPR